MDNLESKIPETVSYYDHQEQLAREERHTNRWRVFAIIVFAALVISNIFWIYRETQYEDVVTVTQDVDTESSPAYVNGTGSMTVNGEDKTNSN